jgi:hypothetical protein
MMRLKLDLHSRAVDVRRSIKRWVGRRIVSTPEMTPEFARELDPDLVDAMAYRMMVAQWYWSQAGGRRAPCDPVWSFSDWMQLTDELREPWPLLARQALVALDRACPEANLQ